MTSFTVYHSEAFIALIDGKDKAICILRVQEKMFNLKQILSSQSTRMSILHLLARTCRRESD